MADPLFGTHTSKTVLWLDLWGMSKSLEDHKTSGGNLLSQAEIAHRLSIFISALAVLANQKPNQIEIAQGSDGAFVIGDDPNEVFDTALRMFTGISFLRGNFLFIPIRGGISKNLIEVESNKPQLAAIRNFSYLPYLGEGFAKASRMEAHSRKGMRLFITESVRDMLNASHRAMISPNMEPDGVSILKEPSEPFYEVQWMSKVHLGQNMILHAYQNLIDIWKKGNGFQVDMAQSLEDQITWVDSGAQNKSW
jgi:hypothetical protein